MFWTVSVAAATAAPCGLLSGEAQSTQCTVTKFSSTPATPTALTNADAAVHVDVELKCTGDSVAATTATLFATVRYAIPNAELAPNAAAAATAGTYCQSMEAVVTGTFPTFTASADLVLAPWAVTGWAGVAAVVGVQFPFTTQGQYIAIPDTAAVAGYSGSDAVTPSDDTTGTLAFTLLQPPVRGDARLDADWLAFKLVAGLQKDVAAKRGEPSADVVAAVGKLTPYAVRVTSTAFGGQTPATPSLLDVLRATASATIFAELLPLCAADVLANITAVGGAVFPPSDSAFAAANVTNASAWAAAHPAECASLLRAHYTPTMFVSSALPVGGVRVMASLGGQPLVVTATLDQPAAALALSVAASAAAATAGVSVTSPDLVARNGAAHVLAGILPHSPRTTPRASAALPSAEASVGASRRSGAPLAPQSTAAVSVQFVWPGPAAVPAGWEAMVVLAGQYAAARMGDNSSATSADLRLDPAAPAPSWADAVGPSESRPAYALWMGVVITVVSVLVFLGIAVRTFRQRATFE